MQGAADSQTAIQAAADRLPDIFIADVKMKGVDGLQTLAALQCSNPPFQSMVITGFATEEDSIRAIKLGVGDYLRKPFDTRDFVQAVERLASRAALHRQVAAREQAAERLVRWSLEMVAGSVDLWQPLGQLPRRRAGGLATDAARLLGHSVNLAVHLGHSVLISLLRQNATESDLGLFLQNASPQVLSLLEEIERGQSSPGEWSEAGALGAAIVFWCKQPKLEPANLENWLSQRLPTQAAQRLTAAVLECLRNPTSRLPNLQPQREPSLLAMGRALRAGGDPAGAKRAFLSILEAPSLSDESGEALLELARLDPSQSHYQEQLLERLPSFSPLLGARLKVELACQPGLVPPDRRLQLLEEATQTHRRLGLRAPTAQSCLALWSLGKLAPEEAVEAFRILTEAAHFETLINSVAWLLPPLLERAQPLGGVDPIGLVGRLIKESPRTVAQLIRSGSLSPQALGRLLDSLEKLNTTVHKETLELLSTASPPEVGCRAQALLSKGLAPGLPILRLHSFGSFRVHLGDFEVADSEWGNQKAKFVLACLAYHQRPVDQEVLIEQFWPESPPERGKRNLYQVLSLIRKVLRPPHAEANSEFIVRHGSSLSLNRNLPIWHDLQEWQRSLREAEAARHEERWDVTERALHQAFQLYQGSFLESCYMEWAVQLRNILELQALGAFSELAELVWKSGNYAQVVGVCSRILGVDPCRQATHHLLMESFLKLGRPEDAVRQFESCRAALRSELGLEPTTDLLRTFQKAKLEL